MSHESSLSAAASEEANSDFKTIITTFLAPLKQSCHMIAGTLNPLESAIFTANCLHAIQVQIFLSSENGMANRVDDAESVRLYN